MTDVDQALPILRSRPLVVPCPHCGAEPGRGCITRDSLQTFTTTGPHPDRLAAAEAAFERNDHMNPTPLSTVGPATEGVWMVAGTSWGSDGPGWVMPYASEIDALRKVNENDGMRAYFVHHGTDLQEAMNAPR